MDGTTIVSAGVVAGAALDRVDALLGRVEADLSVAAGDPRRVTEVCAALIAACDADPAVAGRVCALLGRLLASSPNRPGVAAAFECLQARALAARAPPAVYAACLQVRDRALRLRAVTALSLGVEQGLAPPPDLLELVATALRDCESTPPGLAAIVAAAAAPNDVASLLSPQHPFWLRSLAARVLDADGLLPTREHCALALGAVAADRLAHHMAFSRASHRDLLWLTDEATGAVPLLASLERAESVLGVDLLARTITELGWPRVSMGLEVLRLTTVRIGGGFPLLVSPAEAALLEACGDVERGGEIVLVTGHGRIEGSDAVTAGDAHADRIRRFREYNVLHADLLNDILEVAPLTGAKARSMLDRLGRIAVDFEWLFGQHDEEAARVGAVAERLISKAHALLPADDAAVLGGEAARLLQAFEDPSTIGRVSTLHGLKRYLHQRGLRNAFRLFQSGAAANRSVDLLLIDEAGGMRVARRIRYIEFEPPREGDVPPIVRMVVDSYTRWLAHGATRLPDVRLLIYAHEVQLYLSFRAHPAFVRMDLSPPRRGGMVDLEYFAVSQNELAQHPARHLDAMQHFLRRLGFFVSLEGLRIHARYDKERAFDRADILDKASSLLRLAPLLMDLDWTIGSLVYSRDTRVQVQSAWASFFERHGVLPLDSLLSADRCRILLASEDGREDTWDGIGAYRDRYGPGADASWWPRLQAELERRGLDGITRVDTAGPPPGQRELERRLLQPLRAALESGAAVEVAGHLQRAGPDVYRDVHEAVRLAALLDEGGVALDDAARLGAITRNAFALFRFRTTGTVQGFRVERADLALSVGPVSLFALCDGHGVIRIACATAGFRPAQRRDAAGAWRWHNDISTSVTLEHLLRDNYLAPLPLLAPLQLAATDDLRDLYARPALRPLRAALPDDRVLEAEPAAPGRTAGVVRLPDARASLQGAILTAPVVRAEDAPLLKAAAGTVTTGGGILSHAALIALELRKPALLLRGTFERDTAGAQVLRLLRTEYHERREYVGPYEVVSWDVVRQVEEEVRDGDLAVIDADEGTFRLLGQDRTALALHHGLADLEQAAGLIEDAADHAHVLELRGRLLRTMHAMRRELQRLTVPGLAHHAARQLLAAQSDPTAAAAGSERRELLRVLLDNPHVGHAAAAATFAAVSEMVARFRALAADAAASIDGLERPIEVVFLRHAVARLAAGLRGLELMLQDGPSVDDVHDVARRIDGMAARRLAVLRNSLLQRMARYDHDRARVLLPQLSVIDAALTPTRPPPPLHVLAVPVAPAPAGNPLTGRYTVTAADVSGALAGVAGNKAAGLAELVRILGPAAVPAWFAITDHAFREVLAAPLPAGAGAGVPRPAAATLGAAIAEVLARPALDVRDRAAAIAALWRDAAVPERLARTVREAYAELCDDCGGAAPVAVRSSSLEEDRVDTAWAGQFSTFLNVHGADAVLDHVKQAWAGLWGERALLRRGAAAAPPGGGVIVQRMVAARVAGVLHTVSVANADLRSMVANVGIGLGAGIVSGEVGVDEVRITKGASATAPMLDVQYRIGDKREQVVPDVVRGSGTVVVESSYHQRFRAALEYSEVFELASVATTLEAELGQPLDIEFAFERDRLRVLQVRPIPLFHHALTETLLRFPIEAGP